MKAILDTCVVIDFLQKREPFANTALQIFRAAAGEQFTGCITAKSATDIYYLTHRCTHSDEKARNILNSLLSIVSMLDSTAVDVFHALSSETTDFEDAVMIETAIRSKVDCIVTRNTKDYLKSSVPVYTPDDFMKALEDEGLTVVRNYKSCGSGRGRCDRDGHAVFLRPRVDSAIMGSASTGISTSSTKLKKISTFCRRLPLDLSGA